MSCEHWETAVLIEGASFSFAILGDYGIRCGAAILLDLPGSFCPRRACALRTDAIGPKVIRSKLVTLGFERLQCGATVTFGPSTLIIFVENTDTVFVSFRL